MSPRHSAADAARTRDRIVRAAMQDASRFGLEGLTVGTLARRLGMSKAGLIGPFGSRDRLLMAALNEATEIFRARVIAPLEGLPPGAERLEGLIDRWVAYLSDSPFFGGCLVIAASTEFDGRPGPLRDRLREINTSQRRDLAADVVAAQAELPGPHRPPEEVVATLIGLAMAANQEIQLLEDPSAPARIRTAMRHTAGLPV